jgi:FkbM family methyltransferase
MNEFYSQEGQDFFLETQVFKGHKNGVFFDIGAHDGKSFNNTLYFETANGWTGVNVEPIKSRYEDLVKNRPNCININCAVSDFNGEGDFLTISGYAEMLSGIISEFDQCHVARIYRELGQYGGSSNVVKVQVRTIESICDEHNITIIDYLSIDVEGAEFKVIKSINFDKVFIEIIGFENNYNDMNTLAIVSHLESNGYRKINLAGQDIFMVHKNSKFNKYRNRE